MNDREKRGRKGEPPMQKARVLHKKNDREVKRKRERKWRKKRIGRKTKGGKRPVKKEKKEVRKKSACLLRKMEKGM